MSDEKKEVKAGVKTSEFWLAIGALLGGNAAAFSETGEESVWLKLGVVVLDAVVAAVYAWVRTKAKAA